MIKSFSRDEKMALIAILKFIISSDGMITKEEISKFNAIAEEKGFEDFNEIFDEVDMVVKSLDDIKELIKKVENSKNEYEILKIALEISRVDANINPEEARILQIMSEEWNIDLKKIINKS